MLSDRAVRWDMSSAAAMPVDPLPLREDADGVLRLGVTRVSLDLVVEAFDDGATPEAIAQQYSTLNLADVYGVLAHVLRHRAEIDAYLAQRREAERRVRTSNESRWDPRGVRERLMARRAR